MFCINVNASNLRFIYGVNPTFLLLKFDDGFVFSIENKNTGFTIFWLKFSLTCKMTSNPYLSFLYMPITLTIQFEVFQTFVFFEFDNGFGFSMENEGTFSLFLLKPCLIHKTPPNTLRPLIKVLHIHFKPHWF